MSENNKNRIIKAVRKNAVVVGLAVLLVASALGGAVADRLFVIKPLDYLIPRGNFRIGGESVTAKLVKEESVVIDVAEEAAPSVVTVSVKEERQVSPLFLDPFGAFGQVPRGQTETVEQDIGSGFVVEGNLVVTNKHVVSSAKAEYKVIDRDGHEHAVTKIYRDPANDLAILQVADDGGLAPIGLGDSENLKVGQFVIAIGTALGEFRHTVTTGVISGLGRGIEAGDGLGGFVERLDNVIQTDAAINPGNSGGPLLNTTGQVIGINTAVAGGENIGFAIPINVLRESLTSFEETGRFDRAFLGVRYQQVSKETAILNEVPAGAYLREVVSESPADDGGLQAGDIITKIDGQAVDDQNTLESIIAKHKVRDRVRVDYWRDGKSESVDVVLESSS